MEPTPRAHAAQPSPVAASLVAALVPIGLATAGYARILRGEFLFDDIPGIVESQAIKGAWPALRSLFAPEGLLTGRPLTTLTFAANYAAGRLDPLGYHAVNLLLHLGVVLLAALLTRRVAALAGAERPGRIAAGVAGLFAVHPLHSQAVSYVSQRSELLASGLYVATLLLLLARDPGVRPRPWGLWLAAALTFLLGFAAKPIILTLPAALLAIHLAAAPEPSGSRAWRRVLPVCGAFAVAATLVSAALLAALRGSAHAGISVAGTGPWRYFLTQLRACVVYLRLLAWPAGQSADWTFPTSPGLADPATLGAALAISALVAAAAWLLLWGRRTAGPGGAAARLAGLGLAWFFILLAPTSSFVPLADNLVEHRAYLASWGVILAVVAAVERVAASPGGRRFAAAAWLALLLLLSAALYRRNGVWQTQESLWRDVVAKAPESARGRMNLGDALDSQGRFEEAIAQYELALPLTAGNVSQQGQILRNLGGAQMNVGRTEDARRSLEAGLHFLPDDDRLLVSLALLAGGSGDVAAAESLANRALAVNPGRANAWLALGNVALERGDWEGALSRFVRAASIDPDAGEAQYGRALALRMMERRSEECAALHEALGAQLRPAYRNLIGSELAARCR
jgi:tetratricopeptide (TPR) repeat protein